MYLSWSYLSKVIIFKSYHLLLKRASFIKCKWSIFTVLWVILNDFLQENVKKLTVDLQWRNRFLLWKAADHSLTTQAYLVTSSFASFYWKWRLTVKRPSHVKLMLANSKSGVWTAKQHVGKLLARIRRQVLFVANSLPTCCCFVHTHQFWVGQH